MRCRGSSSMRSASFRLLLWLSALLLRLAESQPAQPHPSIDPHHHIQGSNSCYDQEGVAQRCVPDFINAAFNLLVEVSNTCGEFGPNSFCVQTGHSGMRKVCDICDARIDHFNHPASYLTDFNNVNNETWWQSETMLEGVQYPNMVNLTLRLGKSFDITYIRLKFVSPRPESFAIYKKTTPDDEWVPWQYYSASCRSTYGMPERAPIMPDNENVAQCTKEYSDISPLTGGNIAFSTLEGRPSSFQFEDSDVLQRWVTATQIRVVLNRLNTFGDEVFRDPQVLRSYYYAISDFAVGGRCKCNGHASECVKSTGEGGEKLVCRCEHNAQGADCQECKPFYNDRPWRAATATDANECKACNCNNLATRCYYDQELFDRTGSGGHCIDCTGNTQGPHCEECLVDHWRRPREHYCVPCNCNAVGSLSQQCDENGQCQCKPGVEGQYCDRCKAGFYEFDTNGCKDCQCNVAGSYQNQPLCNAESGVCTCKANVEGKQCELCKPGYFDMSSNNQFGCTPCFCFGHSSICQTAPGYFAVNVSSDFSQGKGKWSAVGQRGPLDVQWAELDKAAAVSDVDGSPVYFVAPDRFLGDQRAAYNQDLVFTLRVHQANGRPSVQDIIIVGADGQELAIPIFAQENPNPTTEEQTYRFRIHANAQFQWHPRLNELDFIGVLSNITALKIRGTYSRGDVGLLSSVHLGSASLAPSDPNAPEAQWVESCECLQGFVGQFCESCAPGYRREMKFGGSFNRCVKCDCHNHSDSCDAESGACICEHNTAGDTCNRCARGYYGNALQGTPDDCEKCPCPEDGPCILHSDNDIICTECPVGYSGRRCDMCADGFFGDPQAGKPCKECECSGNIDPNSIGNCDSKTGECKKCIYNTRGFNCEKCAKGFWGDALLEPKGDCQPCSCYAPATVKPSIDYDVLECRQEDGQCECQPHVTGLQCNQCEAGYYNLTSGTGCHECNCDALGSLNTTCNLVTGQCQCKPGITGRRCDQCEAQHFGFSAEGCKRCDCEVIGSSSLKCDVNNGQCQCRTNIVGRRCDKCAENMYDIQRGCLKCDECYTLIQRRVNDYRAEIAKLQDVLTEIIENPVQVNDTDFDNRLAEVSVKVEELAALVNDKLAGDDSALVGQVNQLKKDLAEASKLIKTVDETIKKAGQTATATDQVLSRWNSVKDRAFSDLERAQKYLETEGKTQWELATEAAAKYGEQSQQLSEIAQEARKLADKHENRSIEIEKLADVAINASKQALDDAKEAIFGAESTSQQIDKLKSELDAAEDVYNKTAHLAAEQLKEATAANKEAAETLTTVEGLQLPNVDTAQLSADAKKVQDDAKMTQENAQTEAAANKQVIDDAARATQEANYQLQRAVTSQQEVDAMLAEVDAAKAKALEAVALAENTLKDANEMLSTLIDFNNVVEQSKEKALKELEKVAEIEEQIAAAESRTKEAEAAIGNARTDAKSAEEIAVQANKDANDASQAARRVKNETVETKRSAANMKADAASLSAVITEASSTLDNYKKQAASDKARAAEAVTAAAKAENTAKMSNKTITNAAETVKGIIDQLNSLDDVSESELDELEKQLEEAKKALGEANLEGEVSGLKEKQTEQQRKISQYKNDITKLLREVENIEEIRNSLPNKCFNVVNLEQEGQK